MYTTYNYQEHIHTSKIYMKALSNKFRITIHHIVEQMMKT